jgi:signal transduction histidine kinase
VSSRPDALAAVSEAVLGIAGDLSLDTVLERLVHAARDLVGARYAALGTPEEEGDGFARFITAGMSEELVTALGPLPRTHGLLGAMLVEPTPYRTGDVTADPRFRGWWPDEHPVMRSFLGVPITFRGAVLGAFYLTDKVGAAGFDEEDERVVVVLAAHAGVLIEQALLYERAREVSVVEERDRLARELHDAVTQSLFSARLLLATAAGALDGHPPAAAGPLAEARSLVDDAVGELRALVTELRPPDLEAEGLVAALRRRVDVVGRAHGLVARLEVAGADVAGLSPEAERQLYRIAQEAITNAVRHAGATALSVALVAAAGPGVMLTVTDDGRGFDPGARGLSARHLGLTSMRERAAAVGGRLVVESAPGAGTTVRVEVPVG